MCFARTDVAASDTDVSDDSDTMYLIVIICAVFVVVVFIMAVVLVLALKRRKRAQNAPALQRHETPGKVAPGASPNAVEMGRDAARTVSLGTVVSDAMPMTPGMSHTAGSTSTVHSAHAMASAESGDVDESAPVAYRTKTRESISMYADHGQEGAQIGQETGGTMRSTVGGDE